MNQKRVNFNMQEACHALLKSACALKGVTVSEYVYKMIQEDFAERVRTDNQIQTMFLSGTYPVGSNAYRLKELLIEELDQLNDSST